MPIKQLFLNFLKHPVKTGSVVPSSRFLVQKLVKPINTEECSCVVELGTGEGCVTEGILRHVDDCCRVLSFEINNDLLAAVSCKNRNLRLINDDAENLLSYLKRYKIKEVDYVVSSLPLAQIPREKRNRIFDAVYRSLRHGGQLLQYQYSLMNLRDLREVFPSVEVDFTPLNIPPAFIYKCTK